jgi:hypothetical protein
MMSAISRNSVDPEMMKPTLRAALIFQAKFFGFLLDEDESRPMGWRRWPLDGTAFLPAQFPPV